MDRVSRRRRLRLRRLAPLLVAGPCWRLRQPRLRRGRAVPAPAAGRAARGRAPADVGGARAGAVRPPAAGIRPDAGRRPQRGRDRPVRPDRPRGAARRHRARRRAGHRPAAPGLPRPLAGPGAGTVPGLDTEGDGGLLGLALSPTFDQDGLVYAYVSTATDNRVVRFPLGGTPNPVLTGIPHGTVHNGGGLLFTSDGHLLVGTGDTGNPALAADPRSLAGQGAPGRRLRACPRGRSRVQQRAPQRDGPVPGDLRRRSWPRTPLRLRGPTSSTRWSRARTTHLRHAPLFSAPAAQAGFGGCAVAGSTVFVGTLAGKRVDVVHLDGHGVVTGTPDKLLPGKYGRLRSVAVDTNGGVWVTTSNRDGVGTPGKDDDKVLRILPPSAQSNSPLYCSDYHVPSMHSVAGSEV